MSTSTPRAGSPARGGGGGRPGHPRPRLHRPRGRGHRGARGPRDGGPGVGLVNPFIGSQGDGNTFPGAVAPFGMAQPSPDTGHNTGYAYDDDHIRGFSMVHISGVGCGLGGDLPMLPTTGVPTTAGLRLLRAALLAHR